MLLHFDGDKAWLSTSLLCHLELMDLELDMAGKETARRSRRVFLRARLEVVYIPFAQPIGQK